MSNLFRLVLTFVMESPIVCDLIIQNVPLCKVMMSTVKELRQSAKYQRNAHLLETPAILKFFKSFDIY